MIQDPKPASRSWPLALAVIPAVVVTTLLGAYLHREQRQLEEAAAEAGAQLDAAGNLRPLAIVERSLEAMAVVTEIVESDVSVEQKDESWRGDTVVRIRVPVRYIYAVNLKPGTNSKISFDRLTDRCSVTITKPQRIATEVMIERPTEETIETPAFRYAAMSGTTQLLIAMKRTREVALHQQLAPDKLRQIEDSARQRVQTLLQDALGPQFTVDVDVAN